MKTYRNMREYRADIRAALDDAFLGQTLDKFARSYSSTRPDNMRGLDLDAAIAEVRSRKAKSVARLPELLKEFTASASKNGVTVHQAASAAEANSIIADIAAAEGCRKIVKSKSMTSEETRLNSHLEAAGLEVTETDLGECIIQLRHEMPSHMVLPAIHLSRGQIANLFSGLNPAKELDPEDITALVRFARARLRDRFAQADMGISGANFALADTGSLGLCTNEGNGRLVTTLPRVHVALVGLEKLVPSMADALAVLRILPRNATGQVMTSYVTLLGAPEQGRARHVVFLDNGRGKLAADPVLSESLHCIRCGACANVCPVYRQIGGHRMGHIYIGPIGLVLTRAYHGDDAARLLAQNCINCGACKAVCAAGIDLPRQIQHTRALLAKKHGLGLLGQGISKSLSRPLIFKSLMGIGKYAQLPLVKNQKAEAENPPAPAHNHRRVARIPSTLLKGHDFRSLPGLAPKSFRQIWRSIAPPFGAKDLRMALFGGCAQEYIYPEHLLAATRILNAQDLCYRYPSGQACCGLPVLMTGADNDAARLAMQNLNAFDPDAYDYIVTLCASCASTLKHRYPQILAAQAAGNESVARRLKNFTGKIIDFSSFLADVLKLGPHNFRQSGLKTAYHAPCHLCRELDVHNAPRSLISACAEYIPADEEESCCGFGGSYSVKFPEISAAILQRKTVNYQAVQPDLLVTDCPGCVIQLRGGAEKAGAGYKVKHIAELLADNFVE